MVAGVKSVHGKLVKEAVNHKIYLWNAHYTKSHLLSRTLIYVCVGHHDMSLGRHQIPFFLELVTGERYVAEEKHISLFQSTSGFHFPSSCFSKFIVLFIVLCVLLDSVFINRCLFVIYK